MNPPLTAYNFSNSESDDQVQRILDSLIDQEVIDVQVLPGVSGEIVEAHCMSLIFIPDTGFDNSQSKLVRKIVDQSIDTIFVIIVTDSLLEVSVRQGHGLKSLCESIKEQYDVQPVCIPSLENMEIDIEPVQSFKLLLDQRVRIAIDIALLTGKKSISVKATKDMLSKSAQNLHNIVDVRDIYNRLKVLQDCRDVLNKLKKLYEDTEANRSDLNNDWRQMSSRLRNVSVQIVTKQAASTYYSYLMSLPVVSKMAELSNQLKQKWITPPERYKSWQDEFLLFTSQPRLLMPVVGLFSSGKTTFLNSLLNSTPEKNECLHTDRSHNTAMLLCLKGTDQSEPETVNFTWKSHIDIPILQENSTAEVPKRSPLKGIVTDVISIDPFAIIKITSPESRDDFNPSIIVLKNRIKSYIKPGYRINKGDLLTKDEIVRTESFNDSFNAEVYPYALKCSIEFLKESLLEKVEIRTEYRKQIKTKEGSKDIGYSVVSINDPQKQLEFLEDLQRKINHSEGRGSKPLQLSLADYPVKVNLNATLNYAKSPELLKSSILLDSGMGWDEFQGRNTEFGYRLGFAESEHVAWLLEKADLKVNNSLFKLVELVDTPGINSISQHHDRITFDYINRGNAFIILVGLRFQDKTQDMALFETLTRVIVSFIEQKVDQREWGERTFIIFNWFHTRGNPEVDEAVVVKRIENLRIILSTMFPYSIPNLYLIDASQSKYDDSRTLLGYPSVIQLIEDLPRMVSKHFLSSELGRRLESLIELHDRSLKSIDEEIQRLNIENNDEYVEKLQSDMESINDEQEKIIKEIRNEFHDLNHIAYTVSQADFQNKEDYEDKKNYYHNTMKKFNMMRNEIYGDVLVHLNSIKKRYARYTAFSFAKHNESNLLNDVPTFLPDDFSSAIDRIVKDWPSWFGRLFKRLGGNWKAWLDSKNYELRKNYYSEHMIYTMYQNSDRIRDMIIGWVNSEFHRLREYLSSESSKVTASRNERNAIVECLNTEKLELERFEQNYTSTTTMLQQAIQEGQEKNNA